MPIKLYVAAVLVLAESVLSQVPFHDPWFDILVFTIIMSAATSGMPEPGPKSGDFYVWTYRTMHLIFHMSTSYMTHKSFWPAFEAQEVHPKAVEFDRPKVIIKDEQTTALAKKETEI